MLLEMALGSKAPASFQHRCRVTATILLVVCAILTKSAPTTYDEIQAKRTDLMDYFNDQSGCYYNYQHYEEGDRIMTNEPCLNCTCHNRMLMCYLRVCPAFSKAIGQDCTVQKSPDQCCPTISCPEVPVQLLTSTTTQMPTTSTTTEVGWHDNYGCMMNDNEFFPDGAQVPSNPKKPCELCYCIRNRTACVMQECTLHVEGCRPVYQEAVCCPVRYDCDYESEKPTTSAPQISGGLVFSTTAAPFDCLVNNEIYKDGESIKMVKEKPCEHCYCMRGDIVCAVQDCGEPLRGKDCTPETPPAGQCCPTSYQCANETISSDDITTLQPPSQSHSDENEAEKYPLNEDIYDKLGESQSNSQDDTNDVESENTHTTQINIIDSPAILTSDQATDKNEEVHNSVPNVSPTNDGANKISDENKPVHNEYIKPQTETTSNEKQDPSKQSNEENIVPNNNNSEENVFPTEQNKPLEESNSQTENQSQSENILLEQNQENTQTPIVENHQDNSGVENILPTEIPNVENQATEQNKLPIENNLQTDSKPESENTPAEQNQNNLLPTEIPKVQNDAITEPGKLESENASKEQNPVSPQIESVLPTEISKVENEPTEQNKPLQETNPLANDKLESGNKITDDTQNNSQSENESTEIPKIQYKPTEQSELLVETNSQTSDQPESESTSTEANQNNLYSQNFSPTEIPKDQNEANTPIEGNQGNTQTENKSPTETSNVENKPIEENNQNTENTFTEQNLGNSQVQNLSPTEIPKVENEPTEENKPLVENNQDFENVPTEQNQDSSHVENASPTDIPEIVNEPTEQNKPLVENNQDTENMPTEQNQYNSQVENASPTDIPELVNEPTEQNKPLVENNQETENVPTEQNQDSSHVENTSSTDIPEVQNNPLVENNQETENVPTEQNQDSSHIENASSTNIPEIQNKPLVENNQETENVPTEQNQDSSQVENASPTDIPKIGNEPTEQSKPLVENNQDTENVPTEQNQDSSHVENALPTDIPEIVNKLTEQNKPLVENNQDIENVPTEQNQDSLQMENSSPTDIPEIVNEPNEQNKPLVENNQNTEIVPTEQNQDSSHLEYASPTDIPEIVNEPTEQNKPLVENNQNNENVSTEQNQDSSHVENASPTDIPKIVNEPTEQSKPLVESNQDTENVPTEQNQGSSQVENASPTDIPEIVNELNEQNKPLVENNQNTENVPTEQNQDSTHVENSPSTDIPEIQNKPLIENNQDTENVPTEQNQDSTHVENSPSTDIPEIQNKPLIENNQDTENVPTEQNQDSSQVENASPTEIPKIVNEHTEQNKPSVENNQDTENVPTEQNQDSFQVENALPTEIPNTVNKPLVENNKVDENRPTEHNQDSSQVDDGLSTEIPKVENEPTEQNKPLEEHNKINENIPSEQNQDSSHVHDASPTEIPKINENVPTEQNLDSSQVENLSPTEIPKVENEPTEQNKPLVENNQDFENMPTEQNQDSSHVENASPTDIPEIVNEPTEQNKPLVENNQDFENMPTEQNQYNSQVENASPTEIPKVENEPNEQNNPIIENNKVNENIPIEQNQDSSHVDDASSTEIPKLSENLPTQQNQDNLQVDDALPTEIPKVEIIPTEQHKPLVENNSPGDNQPELQNNFTEQYQDNLPVENVSSTDTPKIENESIQQNNPTEKQPESQNTPTGQLTSLNPIENTSKLNEPQTENVVPEKTQIKPAAPAISENNASTDQPEDNIFVVSPSSPPLFSDNQVKGQESTSIPISDDSSTEKNVDKVNPQPSADDKISSAEYTDNISPQSNNKNTENSTGIKPIISEDDSSASNDVTGNPINEHLPANGEQSDNRLGLNNQANSESTLIPTIETSSVNPENINQDVLVDNISSPDNQPVIVNDQDIVSNSDPNEIKTSTETENSDNNHVNDFTTNSPQQQLDDNSIPMKLETVTLKEPIKTEDQTKSPNIFSENDTTEKSPESNAPIEISGNQNSDEIFKPTESDVITKLTESTINGIDNIEHSGITQSPNQNNNYENITPHEQSQNKHDNNIIENTSIDPDTSADDKNNLNIATELNQHNEENFTPLSDKIETNSNKVTPIEDESTVIPQLNQVNQGNLENTSNIENLSTTNGYSSEPSVVSSTNIPESQDNGEDENLIVNPTTIKTNINNDQLPNVVPQNNESTNVESTEYNVDDNSTNSPSEVSTNVNNVEANTNASPSKINNGINQDQTTEFEVYGTQSPTEKNILTDVSNKTPTNDAPSSTSQINTNNEIINEYSSENPQNILNKITTSNIYKDNEATTEYVQPGVPGEGSCLINFVTYAHKAEVPKSNPCHEKCECLNSIITCTSVNCPPAPPQHRNCIPLHPGNESWCCPTYMCDGGIEGVLFENNQQLGSPQLISTILLEDKPGEQNDNKTTIDEVSSTSIPQILLEYTSLATPESETSSDVNLQNSDVLTQTETPNKQTDELIEINKPINADKSSEDEKPSDNSEIDGTTISYTPDLPIVTNQPDTSSNDIKEQNPFPNVVNESQDYPIASSTEEPNYESTVANIHPPSDPSQPEQNSEFDASIVPTTDRPIEQINDNKSGDGINNPIIDKGSEKDTTSDVTDLLENIVNPLDVTQTPNIANDKPSLVENNSNNLRPASIDDIISSVNMVKDAVKNSLETSSKPTESNYQGTESAPIENQPTVLPENLANPSSENSLPEKYNEPFTTVSSINIIPELQTNDEKSPENSVGTELPESVGATQIPNHLEPGNSDSGTVLTDSPISNLPNTQETTGPIMEANADDKTPAELTTAQYSSGTNEQDPTSNGSPILHTVDSTVVPQVNIEPNTNIPEADNKISQISTQQDVLPSSSSESQPTQEQEKPNDAESPISPTVEVIVPPMEEAVDSTGSQSSSTNNPIVGGSTLTNDVKITGEQTSSTLATPVINEEHLENENINPAHETGDMMHIPFNTEKPHSKPTPSSTPFPPPVYTAKPPSYTPIPQSTWTPKPFHQDSITSEAPQPDQGFPDEYEDESEAVFGPGTCRYGGKVYVSAQQVPRDDPCDFCFCFRGDIICLQQSCPPPIFGCYQENIQGFCCPRYECPVAQATTVNVTTTTTTSTTVVPPHFFANAYRGAARRAGCLIHGHAYRVGEDVGIASGPCLECICGADGKMKCDPKPCSPEPLLRKMMAEAVDQKKR